MTDDTRASLLLRVRDWQDQQAWKEFVDIYTPLLLGYARKMGLQESDAWNVTQIVFSKIIRSLRGFQYDPDRGRFRDWLGTVIRHEIIRHWKQNRCEQPLPTEPIWQDADWQADYLAHILRTALDRIEPEFDAESWETFEAVWLRDSPPQHVAKSIERPVQWVYQAKFRVTQRLRQEVLALAEDFVQVSMH